MTDLSSFVLAERERRDMVREGMSGDAGIRLLGGRVQGLGLEMELVVWRYRKYGLCRCFVWMGWIPSYALSTPFRGWKGWRGK